MTKFKNDLRTGQTGEALFHANFPNLKRLDGFKHDFINESNGTTFEVKCDTYDMQQTPNFFIEVLSDVARNKPGGPFQAAKNGTTNYEYMYIKNKRLFSFSVDALVGFILANRDKYRSVDIENEGWVTAGILVPRADVAHLYIESELK